MSIADWSSYLTALAGAAATLTGLVFVAVSINLSRIISVPGLPGRAAESLIQLFGALIVSTTALIPRQTMRALGTEILAIGVVLWLAQIVLQVRFSAANPGHPWSWLILRTVLAHLATIPFCVAGILLMRGTPNGLYWLVPGFLGSLIAGVESAWVLLVEILR